MADGVGVCVAVAVGVGVAVGVDVPAPGACSPSGDTAKLTSGVVTSAASERRAIE